MAQSVSSACFGSPTSGPYQPPGYPFYGTTWAGNKHSPSQLLSLAPSPTTIRSEATDTLHHKAHLPTVPGQGAKPPFLTNYWVQPLDSHNYGTWTATLRRLEAQPAVVLSHRAHSTTSSNRGAQHKVQLNLWTPTACSLAQWEVETMTWANCTAYPLAPSNQEATYLGTTKGPIKQRVLAVISPQSRAESMAYLITKISLWPCITSGTACGHNWT